jgi:uncharacterized membrane protein (Fun14 family)
VKDILRAFLRPLALAVGIVVIIVLTLAAYGLINTNTEVHYFQLAVAVMFGTGVFCGYN